MQERKSQPLYAIVQYDFEAERPDELNAKAGEPIIVIAQSNHEWFVAKPIGRLGGPGLIPVSFVEVRDPVTSRPIENVAELLQKGNVPPVDAWKKAAADYKAASISLGAFDQNNATAHQSLSQSQSPPPPPPDESLAVSSTQAPSANKPEFQLHDGDIISTHVKSFHYEAEAYWFRINALFLPDKPESEAISLVLYRLYEDFYNFQITLLDLFPREAGRSSNGTAHDSHQSASSEPPPARILPYMPGPLEQVDVDITNTRREDLDTYLRELLDLRYMGAEYILRHEHVLGFFSPGPGDMMENISRSRAETMADEVAANQQQQQRASQAFDIPKRDSLGGKGLDSRMSQLHMGDSGARKSWGDSTGRASSSITPSEQAFFGSGSGGGGGEKRGSVNGGARGGGKDGLAMEPVNRGSPSRNSSNPLPPQQPQQQQTASRALGTPFSPGMPTASTSSSFGAGRYSGQPQPFTAGMTPVSAGQTASPAAASSASASQPAPAFIKIKILDRNTDDMIAIRVPPRVTFDQLVEKVRDRLVAQVSRLQYRHNEATAGASTTTTTASGDVFKDVTDDQTLREWLDREDKLVLYAD